MSRRHFVALAFALSGCAPANPTSTPARVVSAPPWAEDVDLAWTSMVRALAGSWKATTAENKEILVTYRVLSNGSALVETFTTASGKETITVFHRDGRELMLTHYCAQGNQARLRAVEGTADRVVFAFADATNVHPDQDVMQRLVLTMRPGGYDEESVYRTSDGKLESTTLTFTAQR